MKNKGFTPHHFSRKQFGKTKHTKNGAGFTIIEILVVVTIIVILSTMLLINYRSGQNNLALDRAVYKMAQDIRRVQAMAGLEREECPASPKYKYSYGIKFNKNEPTQYLIFADCNGNQTYNKGVDDIVEEVKILNFEEGIEIICLAEDPSCPNPLTLFFIPPDPNVIIMPTQDTAMIRISNGEQSRVVTINKTGLIDIE